MKKWAVVLVILCVLGLTLTAMAAEGKATVTFTSAVQLNGKQLPAGEYKLKWTGNGNDVQVSFQAGKKEVLTAPAKLVAGTEVSLYNAVVKNENSLKEIRLANKKEIIVFAE